MDKETILKQVAEKGYASLTQAQKDIYNTSAPQTGQVQPIVASSLTPTPEPKLPTYKPVNLTSVTEGALAGANYQPTTYTTPSGAVVDAMGNLITPPPEKPSKTLTPAPQDKSLIDRMKSLMGITGDEGLVPEPPVSATEEYKKAYETEELKTKRATISSLNKELADLNAQHQTLKLAEQTIPMQMQEQAMGRGITAGGLQPLTAGELRKNALAMFPVTSRILSVSAQLSATQGDYDNATNYLDKLLTLQQQDRENEYQYRKDLFNFAYQVADKEETKALEKTEKVEEAEKKKKDDFAAVKKDYIAKATAENDFTTATKMALATTEQELATLMGQIKPAEKTGVVNKLTWNEATKRKLPLSMVGMSEVDVINQLNSNIVPNWFREEKEKEKQMTFRPDILQQMWNEFRMPILESSGKISTKTSTTNKEETLSFDEF